MDSKQDTENLSSFIDEEIQNVSEINTYYTQLAQEELENAADYSVLLLDDLKGVREAAAEQVHEFAPTLPFDVLFHVVEHGMEDPYDHTFLRHLIVLHRAHWKHVVAFGPYRDESYKVLSKRIENALSFNDQDLRLTAALK